MQETMRYQPSLEEKALSDSAGTHSRTEEYTFQVPAPPRMIIPPPVLATPDMLDVELGPVMSGPDPSVNMDFLNDAAQRSGIKLSGSSWEYKKRREAQDILPFLYLGPGNVAKDRAFLHAKGITMLVGVQPKSKFGALMMTAMTKVTTELGLEAAWIEANDNQELIHQFSETISAINVHLSAAHQRGQAGKVLIFCESGNERSAAVTAAYLIETFAKVDVVKAIQICGSRRFCCSFDDNAKHLLTSYESLVQAKRSVLQSSEVEWHPPAALLAGGLFSPGVKRGRDNGGEDIEMELGEEGDDERFIDRDRTPFQ